MSTPADRAQASLDSRIAEVEARLEVRRERITAATAAASARARTRLGSTGALLAAVVAGFVLHRAARAVGRGAPRVEVKASPGGLAGMVPAVGLALLKALLASRSTLLLDVLRAFRQRHTERSAI